MAALSRVRETLIGNWMTGGAPIVGRTLSKECQCRALSRRQLSLATSCSSRRLCARWMCRAEPANARGADSPEQKWRGWWFEAANPDALQTLLTMPHADVDATLRPGFNSGNGLRGPEYGVGNTTALMLAAKRGDRGSVEVLIQAGAEMDALRDSNGCSALHYAAAYGQLECAEALVAAGADVDAQDLQGSTPAILAAFACSSPVLSVLVRSGCDLSLTDQGNATLAGHLRNLRMAPQLAEVLAAAGPGGAAKPRRGSKHYRALKEQLKAQLRALGPEELRLVAEAWGVNARGGTGGRSRERVSDSGSEHPGHTNSTESNEHTTTSDDPAAVEQMITALLAAE